MGRATVLRDRAIALVEQSPPPILLRMVLLSSKLNLALALHPFFLRRPVLSCTAARGIGSSRT